MTPRFQEHHRRGTPKNYSGGNSGGRRRRSSHEDDEQRALTQSNSALSELTGRMVENVTEEISGSCEDTLVSVDQVMRAFALSSRDIDAVTRRIDKARRQYEQF